MKPLLCLLLFVLTALASDAQPILSSPANGATNQPLDVVLSWRPTGDPRYHIECTRSGSTEPTVVLFSSTSSVVARGLDWSTLYRWRVRGSDTTEGPWSAEGTFTTEASGSRPVPVSPVNDAIDVAPQVEFRWTDDTPSAQYELQVDTADFVATSPTYTSTSLSYSRLLLPQTSYRWRLREQSPAAGPGPWTKTMEFTTATPESTPAASPTLLTPSNGATVEGKSVVCTWSVPRGAIAYEIRITSDASNDSGAIFTGVEDASIEFPLSSTPTTWQWSVRSTTADGLSDWSEQWSFSTLQSTDSSRQIPTPVLPLNNAEILNGSRDSITLLWIHPDADVEFLVEYSFNDAFTDTTSVRIRTSAHSLSIAQPSVGSTVHWRVATATWWSVSPWSTEFQFTIRENSDESPSIPVLLEPTNGSLITNPFPTLRWETAQGASSYELQLTNVETFDVLTLCLGTGDTLTVADTITRNTQYWWRVRGIRSSQVGEWSNAFRFSLSSTSDVADGHQEATAVIAPQPAVTSIRVLLPEHTAQGTIELLDLRGQHIRTQDIEVGSSSVVFSGPDLTPGFYTVIIRTGAHISFHSVSLLP